jgi:hypothetical protein
LKIFTFSGLFLLLFAALSDAQNARMDALGGNFCVEDISSVLLNPASSAYYTDAVQGTAYQDGTFGPFIGIKSIGKSFSIGIAANMPEYMQSTFYGDAKRFLDSTIDTESALPEKFPPYPHLFAAIKLPFMTFGTEVFYERAAISSSLTENGKRTSVKKEIATAGVNLNTSITIGIFGIYPFMTYAIPSMSGTYIPGTDTVEHSSLVSERSIKGGVELGLSPDQWVFTLGGILLSENYAFQNDRSRNNKNYRYFVNALDLYGGITVYPTDNLLLSVVYSYGRNQYTCNSDDYVENVKQYSSDLWTENSHFAVASCELIHEIPSFNMNVIFRTGVYWYLNSTEWQSDYTEENYRSNENIQYPASVSQVAPTIGIGFEKGILRFDIASKLAGWSGIASGMPVVTGTLTLDFSKIKK